MKGNKTNRANIANVLLSNPHNLFDSAKKLVHATKDNKDKRDEVKQM